MFGFSEDVTHAVGDGVDERSDGGLVSEGEEGADVFGFVVVGDGDVVASGDELDGGAVAEGGGECEVQILDLVVLEFLHLMVGEREGVCV